MNYQEQTRVSVRVHLKDLPKSRGKTAGNYSTDHKKKGKLDVMLEYFATGQKLNRFQAEALGCHVLNTTISDLQKRHEILFQRRFVKVPNRFGGKTQVMEYWLDSENLEKARKITGLDGGLVA